VSIENLKITEEDYRYFITVLAQWFGGTIGRKKFGQSKVFDKKMVEYPK
jgi:hypothetical protein